MSQVPSPGPKERRREKTRKEILRAAAEVFTKKGFHEASIQEIAEVADFSSGSLYNYFDNKEAIFNDLLTDLNESFRSRQLPPDPSLPFEARLRHYMHFFFQFSDDFRDHFRLFVLLQWNGGMVLGREMGLGFRDSNQLLAATIATFLDDAIKRGEIEDDDTQNLALLIRGVITSFSFHWFHDASQPKLTDQTDVVLELITRCIKVKK